MTKTDFNKLLQEMGKKSNGNIFDVAVKMTNLYFTKYYQSDEHDLIKRKYADYLFVYLLEFLSNAKTVSNERLKDNIIEEFMDNIKEQTFDFRQKIYKRWQWCLMTGTENKNEIVTSFVQVYPRLSMNDKVLSVLGLNSIKEN